ncbi:AMP-binding protein, partial [Streptomyces sp. FR-108]|uniref:AMP-binding protein n=1 Tax=Streptomyces sp. FR-108 TaxID=3416665 RepID=UPI003CFACE8D
QELEDGQAESAQSGLHAGFNHMREQANYPLSLAVSSAHELVLRLSYDRSRFDTETVERLAGHLVAVLDAIAADDPDRRVGDLTVAGTEERDQLVRLGSGAVEALPGVGGVHELIAARALVGPDAVAVVSDGEALTYGGLMARAGRLARRLGELGVGAESVVGLCLPRGIDMVVAMLGAWQAGAAYLPLDPEYPAERLEFMLADSGVKVLVGRQGTVGGLSVESVVWLDEPAVTDGL